MGNFKENLQRSWNLVGYSGFAEKLQKTFGVHISQDEYLESGRRIKDAMKANDFDAIIDSWSRKLGSGNPARAYVCMSVVVSAGWDSEEPAIDFSRPENQTFKKALSEARDLILENNKLAFHWPQSYEDIFLHQKTATPTTIEPEPKL